MKRSLSSIAMLAMVAVMALSSCSTHTHTIGKGPSKGVSEDARQWYILWGLVPLNTVDTKAMAGDATDYQIKTESSIWDVLLNLATGIVTVSSRTVEVKK